MNRATTYHFLKNYENALKDWGAAITLCPENSILFVKRGKTYSAMKKFDEAFSDLNKSIELNSENTEALSFRGDMYVGILDNYLKAKEDYDRVLSIDPKYPIKKLTYYAETQVTAYINLMGKETYDENHEKLTIQYIIVQGHGTGKKVMELRDFNNNKLFFTKNYNELIFDRRISDNSGSSKVMRFLLESDAKRYIYRLKDVNINWYGTKQKLLSDESTCYYEEIHGDRSPDFYYILNGNENNVLVDIDYDVDGDDELENDNLTWGEMDYKGEKISLYLKQSDVVIKIYMLLVDKLGLDNIYLLGYFIPKK